MSSLRAWPWMLLLLLLTPDSRAGSAALPQVDMTRYLSPAGEEHLRLACRQDEAEKPSCWLTLDRDGVVIASRWLAPPRALLDSFMSKVGSGVSREATAGEDRSLSWDVEQGHFHARGNRPRLSRHETDRIMDAALALAAGLELSLWE